MNGTNDGRLSSLNVRPGAEAEPNPRVAHALEEYRRLLEGGLAPDRSAFVAQYPEIAAELADCLSGLEFVHAVAPALSGTGTQGAAAGDACAGLGPGSPLGDFPIVREVGRGGMGIVYEAEQLSLGRRVALKVLPLASTLDARHLQRFKNEAQAAAYLQHQNIVPVYSVGCDRGVHYYAMQYIDGQSLAEIIDQLRLERGHARHDPHALTADLAGPNADGPDRTATRPNKMQAAPTRPAGQAETVSATPGSGLSRPSYFAWVARLGEQAALALEHAHQLGVLHRDIKPANLLLDGRGSVWLTDFGLAHLPGDQRLTMTGDLLGTLRYMSPEQALAQRVLVDQRTDVYSLGVTLYELLTLQPAYAGHDRQELLNQIAFKEPRPPRRFDRAIPAELETIVLKAMEKAPDERYKAAQELADDLHSYLADQPIRARRPGLALRLRKWGRRHKAAVTAAIVLLVLTVIGLSMGSWLLWQEKRRAAAQWSRAEENLAFAYQVLDDIYMDVADRQFPHKASLTPEDKQFLERMRTLYAKVAEQGGDTPATRLRTAKAYLRIANVQELLGELSGAKEAYDGAIQLLNALAAGDPGSREYRNELAMAHFRKGMCLADPDLTNGQPYQSAMAGRPLPGRAPFSTSPVAELRAAAQRFESVAASGPQADRYVLDWARCECALADLVPTRAESVALRRHAEKLLARTHFARPADRAAARFKLAQCEHSLAFYLTTYKEKVERLRRAITLFEELNAHVADDINYVLGLQRSRLDLAQLLAEQADRVPGDKANRKAVDDLTRVVVSGLERYTKTLATVPSVSACLLCTRNALGILLAQERNWPEAERQYGLALELARKFEGKFPESVREHHCTGCVLDNLACLYLDDAQHRDPRKALEFAQQAVNHQPGNITFKDTLGEAYFRVGRHHEAVPLLLEYAAHGSLVVDDWFLLAMTHWNLGEKAKARCWYRIGREWMAVHEYQTAKQRALRAEAAGLLGISHASAADGEAELLRDLQEMCRNAPVAQPDRFTGSLDQREPCIYALALNNLAWMCVTSADSPLRHPQRAVRLARYATTIMPREGFYVNTLGVARYRAGHWKEAIATLTRSMELEKGALEAFDTFFLAMAHWQLGEKEKARQWYDRAVQWTETHRYQLQGNNEWPEELRRFRAEAAKLLGITTPSKPPAPA